MSFVTHILALIKCILLAQFIVERKFQKKLYLL